MITTNQQTEQFEHEDMQPQQQEHNEEKDGPAVARKTLSDENGFKKSSNFIPRMSRVTFKDIKTLDDNEGRRILNEIEEEEDEDKVKLIDDDYQDDDENQFNQYTSSKDQYDWFSVCWSNALIFCNIYNFFTFSFFLAYEGFPWGAWLCIEFLIELFMIIDLILRLLLQLCFKTQWKYMMLMKHQKESSYIHNTLVILASVPTSVIIYTAASSNYHKLVWIAIIRCHKLLRLNQIKQYFDARDIRTRRNSFLRSSQVALYILMISHLLTCFWLFVGRVDPNYKSGWIDQMKYIKLGAPFVQQYFDSMYFVVSTMTGLGFSYIYPRTDLEYGMESIIIVVGVSIYIELFALFIVTLYNMNKKRLENMERLEESKKLEILRNFPQEIRDQIRYYYKNMRLRYQSLCEKFDILEQMPNSLKSEFSLFINSELIQQVNFFQFADPAFILLMSKCLKPRLCMAENYVLQIGEVATKMYFIRSGIVKIMASDERTVMAYQSEGTYFGEIGILMTSKRTCSIKARTNSVFFVIGKKDLVTILDQFPLQKKFLQAVAKQRMQTTHVRDLKDYDQEFETAVQSTIARQESKSKKSSIFDIYSQNKIAEIKLEKSKQLYNWNTQVIKKRNFFLSKNYSYLNFFIIVPFSLYLLLDLIATLPFDYLLMIAQIDVVYIQYVRLLRLIKGYRVVELINIVLKNTSVNVPLFRISILSIILILLGHWANCILVLIAESELHAHSRYDGKSLLEYMTHHPYSVIKDPHSMTAWELYFNLLISSITFMDFGDIIPFTVSEEIFSLVHMFIGRIFISFLFAEVASYLSSQYSSYNNHINHRNRVLKWIQLNNIPNQIKKRVLRYFEFKWHNQKGIEEHHLLKDLPTSLRVNVKSHLFQNLVENNEVFPKDNKGAVITIVSRLQRRLIPKDEYIIKQGEIGHEMYFILKGEVKVISQEGITVAVLKKFMHFGEMALIEQQASVRSSSIMANTNVVLAVLTASNFQLICNHYPEFNTRIYQIVQFRNKDSLSKGVKMSNRRSGELQNELLKNFLSQKKTMTLRGSPINRQLSSIPEVERPEFEQEKNLEVSDSYEQSQSEESSNLSQEQNSQDQQVEDQQARRQDSSPSVNLALNIPLNTENNNNASPRLHTIEDQSEESSRNFMTEQKLIDMDIQKIKRHSSSLNFNENPQPRITLSSINDEAFYIKSDYNKDQRKKIRHFVLHTLRHIILFTLCFYNIVFIPLQMGFTIVFEGIYIFMEIMTILFYTIDAVMIVRDLTKLRKLQNSTIPIMPSESMGITQKNYQDQDEIHRKILFARLNLISTIIAITPFSWILFNRHDASFVMNFLRVLRLAKIWPFYRVIQILKKLDVYLVRLLEVLITYYLLAHIVSGVMLNIALTQPDIRKTWINRVPILLPAEVRLENNLDGVSNQTLYIHALFLVSNLISHVAVADINTVSTDERILNSFMMWCLTFVYAFLFANIASIVRDLLGKNFLYFHEKYNNVRSMLPKEKIPSSVLKKISEYYDFKWASSQGYDEDREIFNELPQQIKYDIMLSRYQEAIQTSLIFKNDQGQIDIPLVNSIFENLKVRIYMANDFLVKVGSYSENLYIIMDGEALMLGLNNEIMGIMRSGTHFNNILGDRGLEDFGGKRIVHIVAKTMLVVGVMRKENMERLFEAYPYWKQILTRLNRSIFSRARKILETHLENKQIEPTYLNQIQEIEEHMTYSEEIIYEQIIQKLDDPTYQFIYDPQSKKYSKLDLLANQINVFQLETGIKQERKSIDSIHSEVTIQKKLTILMDNKRHQRNLLRNNHNIKGCSKCFSRFYFEKGTKFRKLLDFLTLINLVYITIAVPLQIAYIDTMEITLILEIISILIQMTPIVVKGEYTLNFKLVLKNYVQHDLVWDLAGALPINLILGYFQFDFPIIIVATFARLTRLACAYKLIQLFEKYEIHLKNQHIAMYTFKTMLLLFLLWHWTACFWFYLNKRIEPYIFEETWYQKNHMDELTLPQRYLVNMYYVIKIVTGVGQRDMITYNDLERIAFLIIINIGDALFAFAFGLIAHIQLHISEHSEYNQFIKKMKNIEEFLGSIKAEDNQRKRVESYFSYEYFTRTKLRLLESKNLENYLPHSLKSEVLYHTSKDILEPMFRHFKSDNLIKDVASVLSNTIYMPGDYIIYKDQYGEEMYFIVEGSVQIIAGDKTTVLKTLTKGSYFGEIAIFMHTKRISYVQAKTFCVVSVLKKQDIDQIILSFPAVAQEFKEEAQRRIAETKKLERINRIQEDGRQIDEEDDEEDEEIQEISGDENKSFFDAMNQNIEEESNDSEQSDNSSAILAKQIGKQSQNIREGFIKMQRNSLLIPTINEPNSSQVNSGEAESSNKAKLSENNITSHLIPSSLLLKKAYSEQENQFSSSSHHKGSIINESFAEDSTPKNRIDLNGFMKNDLRNSLDKFPQNSQFASSPANHKGNNDLLIQDEEHKKGDKTIDIAESRSASPHTRKLSAAGGQKKTSIQVNGNKNRRRSEILPKTSFEFAKHMNSLSKLKPFKLKFQTLESTNNYFQQKKQQDDDILEKSLKEQLKKIEESNRQRKSTVENKSIRRQGLKKNKRRWSQIALGKNLMLSQTAGLKLQWTVGK